MYALSQLLPLLFQLLGPLVALVIVLASARGRAKSLGGVGAGLMLLGGLGNGLVSVLLPMLMREASLSVSTISLLFVPFNLLGIIGLVLLALAVVVGGRTGPANPAAGGTSPNRYDLR